MKIMKIKEIQLKIMRIMKIIQIYWRFKKTMKIKEINAIMLKQNANQRNLLEKN